MNADRRDLGIANFRIIHPDTGAFRNSFAFNSEFRQRVHQNLFNGANESADIAFPQAQIHDRIHNDLARPMISHVTAAIRFVKLDAQAVQCFFRHEHVLRMSVAAHGDYVRMLDEKQMVDALAGLAFRRDPMLDLKRVAVTQAPQIANC